MAIKTKGEQTMNTEVVQIDDIKPAAYNPRFISEKNLQGLKNSITKFGQVANLIINKDGTLISGHQRLKAMTALGHTEALCYVVDLSKPEEKRLNILMNSAAIQGEFDELKLSEMIEELKGTDDYDALMISEIEPLDISEYDGQFMDDDGSGSTGASDMFIKKIVVNLTDYGLAQLLKKLDYIGEDPSVLYQRLLNEKFQTELSGE